MRSVYRITSQKYHNQDSSNLTASSHGIGLSYPTTSKRKQGQRHLRLQLAIERLANFGFGDLGNQGLFP